MKDGFKEDDEAGSTLPAVWTSASLPQLASADMRLPALVRNGSQSARFAYDEFFFGRLRNRHTRRAYMHAVHRFLAWADGLHLDLPGVSPRHVGEYLDSLPLSIASRKLHLAALRHFFDELVNRHAVVLNPAASVRGERYQVVEGKTPEIGVAQARALLASIPVGGVVGLRDRAVVAVLIYTAARVGSAARLERRHFYQAGDQCFLHFDDKGGKSREIPVRYDLQGFLTEYLAASGLEAAEKATPLFRTAQGRGLRLSPNGMTAADIARMLRRRLHAAGLSLRVSPHSFRVTTITDLLDQGVPLGDVQHLAGHADPRTTRLYDRRQKKITRNVVERISV